MKIEKLNDNQIRCTLTRDDLQQRGLRLSELAYGTDKARELFRDMMEQARNQFGFRAENTPLMIEAIPMESGMIILVVTKVSNPEELDARFSSFAPFLQSGMASGDRASGAFDQLVDAVCGLAGSADDDSAGTDHGAGSNGMDVPNRRNTRGLSPQDVKAYQSFLLTHRMYTFSSMSAAAEAARRVAPRYTGESALFCDEDTHVYYLFLRMRNAEEVEALQPELAALTEYGAAYVSPYARMEYVREHCKMVLASDALATLSTI